MDNVKQIVREEVTKYAGTRGHGANLRLFKILDDEQEIYAVNAIDFPIRKHGAGVVVLARIVQGCIVIEEDATDKPLVDALEQRGVPRDKIVLAYAGETVPDAEEFLNF